MRLFRFYTLALFLSLLSTPVFCQLTPTGSGMGVISGEGETLFSIPTAKTANRTPGRELKAYGMLEIDAETYARRLARPSGEWKLSLPATAVNNRPLHLRLRPNEFFSADFKLRVASTGEVVEGASLGQHYVGEIEGEAGSRVSVSLLEDELTLSLTRASGERLSVAKVENQEKSARQTAYVIFPTNQMLQRELDCATPDFGPGYTAKELQGRSLEKSETVGCVDVYFEIDYDVFYDKGDAIRAAAHLAANFNEVASLYRDIGVQLHISEILVWDKISPYFAEDSRGMLTQFQAQRRNFNGDLAQLVSYQASGGIAVIDGLCHHRISQRMSFSSIKPEFETVPTYSWSTMVIAHELGHQLGSRHTHACVWNGNDTAIDGCAGLTEGGCGLAGIPSGGGTIMSYCHQTSVGINFAEGFGDQPAAVIANRVADAQSCTRVDCSKPVPPTPPNPPGGETGADCNEETAYLSLTLDDFGMETTWLIRNERSGAVVSQGGPYPKKQAGRLILDTLCLPEGCYFLEISDTDADGLCCKYGNGNYLLTSVAGDTLGSGGAFDSLDVVDFCLPLPTQEEEGDDPSGNDSCQVLLFNDENVEAFGTNQDEGYANYRQGGRVLSIGENAWKGILMPYQVTEATTLSFWFRSDREGEIHGIGFDNNQMISAGLTFQLYGRQQWGLSDFNTYPGDGEWHYYSIPVGGYYTGSAQYLFFATDEDLGAKNGNSEFRDVQITEGPPCTSPQALEEAPERQSLRLSPNPATARIRVNLPSAGTYRVMDASGKLMKVGDAAGTNLDLSVEDLPSGTYFLHYQGADVSASKRFTVIR